MRGTCLLVRAGFLTIALLGAQLGLGAFAARQAQADGVPPPPPSCPDGSERDSGHCGPYCSLESRLCQHDSDCRDGNVCRTQALCIKATDCVLSGLNAGTHTIKSAVATCPRGNECGTGQACESALRCVRPGGANGGCTVEQRGGGAGRLLVALVVVLAFVDSARRARRRRA